MLAPFNDRYQHRLQNGVVWPTTTTTESGRVRSVVWNWFMFVAILCIFTHKTIVIQWWSRFDFIKLKYSIWQRHLIMFDGGNIASIHTCNDSRERTLLALVFHINYMMRVHHVIAKGPVEWITQFILSLLCLVHSFNGEGLINCMCVCVCEVIGWPDR